MTGGEGRKVLERTGVERLAARLKEIVRRQRLDYVELMSALLAFRTTSGSPDPARAKAFERELDSCLDFLEHRLVAQGFRFRRHDNMVALAERGGEREKRTIGIATHLDVVPPGEDWTVPPFGGIVRDDAIWGRGAQDDKGPVAAILAACDALRRLEEESGGALRRAARLQLLFGTREETESWPDMDLLGAREESPDFVVVPDGAYPVINAEKGIVTVNIELGWSEEGLGREERCRVEVHSGKRSNAVPDRAAVELDAPSAEILDRNLAAVREGMMQASPDAEYQLAPAAGEEDGACRAEFWGEMAHAAYPEKGHNAALDALALVGLLPDAHPALRRFAGALRDSCRHLDGSGIGLAREDPYFGRTTVSLGTLRIGPGRARAAVNVRYPRGIQAEEIEQAFAERLAATAPGILGADLQVRFRGEVQAPIYMDPQEHRDLLGPLNLAYETVTGRAGGYASLAGTTYAKAFPLAVAFGPVDYSAGDEELAHEPDERITVERYIENIVVYATAIFLLAYDWRGLESL